MFQKTICQEYRIIVLTGWIKIWPDICNDYLYTNNIINNSYVNTFFSIIKHGESGSEVIICFGTKFKLSVDIIQLLKGKRRSRSNWV